MAQVAPVELSYNIKTLWFDPNGVEINNGDKVVVQTARGLELGTSVGGIIEVSEESVEALKSELMPVLRVATEADVLKNEEMLQKSREAMPIYREMARQHNEDIHPLSVEFMLDGDKAIFYFESEERVDFRNLVRELASEFHVRIDMRQIGVRDEARIVGGIAHCGQVVCCKRLGGEFKPVSIKMAKNQDLSLNPQKISGLCGRLMCCLRYEDDVYKEFKKLAPKIGAEVTTPDGTGKVVEINVPKNLVTVKVEDGKPLDIPLSSLSEIADNLKSCVVDDEAWQQALEQANLALYDGGGIFDFSNFTGEDKLGEAVAVHVPKTKHTKDESSPSNAGANKRFGSRKGGSSDSQSKETSRKGGHFSRSEDSEAHRERKPRRRSTKIQGESTKTETFKSDESANHSKTSSSEGGPAKLRPGHKSSALSQNEQKNQSADTSSSNGRRQRRIRRSQSDQDTK